MIFVIYDFPFDKNNTNLIVFLFNLLSRIQSFIISGSTRYYEYIRVLFEESEFNALLLRPSNTGIELCYHLFYIRNGDKDSKNTLIDYIALYLFISESINFTEKDICIVYAESMFECMVFLAL